MRRIPLGTLVLAALLAGLALFLAGLQICRSLTPDGSVITHEIKDLIATLQTSLQVGPGDMGTQKGPQDIQDDASLLCMALGAMLLAFAGVGLRRLFAQHRSRNSPS
jgi:lysozyme family protein